MPGGRTVYLTLPETTLNVIGFEGPLELLLHLLDQGKLEITSVALASVAEQYLSFLALLPESTSKLDFLAEFLVVGARLLLLKSRALLPRESSRVDEADAVEDATLEERLVEYQRFRAAAATLRARQERGERAYSRQAPPPLPPPMPPPALKGATPDALARAFQKLLASRADPPAAPSAPPRVSLSERIAEVRAAVAAQRQVSFAWLAEGCASRTDLIVTFLAVLELFRAHAIQLRQDELFGEIWLAAAETRPSGNE